MASLCVYSVSFFSHDTSYLFGMELRHLQVGMMHIMIEFTPDPLYFSCLFIDFPINHVMGHLVIDLLP